jgi:hypothetical protein
MKYISLLVTIGVVLPLLIEIVRLPIVDGEVLAVVLVESILEEGLPAFAEVGGKAIVDLG